VALMSARQSARDPGRLDATARSRVGFLSRFAVLPTAVSPTGW